MKTRIVVELEDGNLTVSGNCSTTELVGLLEAAKATQLAAAGVLNARPLAVPGGGAGSGGESPRAAGLQVRRADQPA
jgi:hypothetical protein